ncbi:MAG: hypothetical protein AB9903_24140 [Vulcanimicrobiota bacterium]
MNLDSKINSYIQPQTCEKAFTPHGTQGPGSPASSESGEALSENRDSTFINGKGASGAMASTAPPTSPFSLSTISNACGKAELNSASPAADPASMIKTVLCEGMAMGPVASGIAEGVTLATAGISEAAPVPPSCGDVHMRSKTEASTGYFDYALKDGKLWMKWNPTLPEASFTIPVVEVPDEKQVDAMLAEGAGPYDYSYDRQKNQIVVTPRPDADKLGFKMSSGRLVPTDPKEARVWHLHDGVGGPALPPDEHIVEIQVTSEFVEARTNKNKMYSYDPTKPDPVEWKAEKGCPFGGDVHLPEEIKDWTLGMSVAVKPDRTCIKAVNPYTDINSYFEDSAGRKGAFGFTATTGVLYKGGHEIRYRDTGLPADFARGFLTPHHGSFTAEKLAQAGSTWLVYGYEPDGTPGLYARMYDYEVNGNCPGKRYTYEDVPFSRDLVYSLNDMVERLPEPGWNHVLFPELSGQALVTDRIDILTTGSGDQEREIRIEGGDNAGATGFYHRKLADKGWQFTPTGEPITGSPVSPGKPDAAKASPEPVTRNFDKATWSGDIEGAPLLNIELLDFHPYQTQDQPSTVRFTLTSGKAVDAIVRTGDGWSMYKAREKDTELFGEGVGLQKVLTGTLEVPGEARYDDDPEVKDFVDNYLMRLNRKENQLMVLADADEVRVVTSWYHRNSDERFDWTKNPKVDITFTRDARGETAYEKRALDRSLRPSEGMSEQDLRDVIERNKALKSDLNHDLRERKTAHKLRWARSEVSEAVIDAASLGLSALNLSKTKEHVGPITQLGPPLMDAHTKADWHTAWTTPAGYTRAVETLKNNIAQAKALLRDAGE